MKREIIQTKDGSKTIHLPEWNESYHSTHGALQEAMHVFIKNGWKKVNTKSYAILEIGFGSGLNAIITLIESKKENKKVRYTGLEAFPVSMKEIKVLNYDSLEKIIPFTDEFQQLHHAKWNKEEKINENFTLLKLHQKMEDFSPKKESFNLIYFDAFGPRVQPEMWTYEILHKMYDALMEDGVFVTYCAKGEVRRNLIQLGFKVEKVPGPPGKREMLFARKV